jgi:hypothetical protein
MKTKTVEEEKLKTIGVGTPDRLKQLHDIIGKIWVIWKGIAGTRE